MDQLKQRCLSLLPDLPRWVETRDLLSWDGSVVAESGNGFVVWSEDEGLGSVVGEPDPLALALAADEVSELLAFPENIAKVRPLLCGFREETAAVFSAPAQLPLFTTHPCRQLGLSEIAAQEHLPSELLSELSDVAEDEVAVIAAFAGSLPVAFAYAASETETLWDVSIDTIESYRRKGFAASAVAHLMHPHEGKG